MSRQALELSKLDQFTARAPAGGTPQETALAATANRFPSREPADEAQLNIKLPAAEAARFRRLAKADRYTLGAFLTQLMDGYERQGFGLWCAYHQNFSMFASAIGRYARYAARIPVGMYLQPASARRYHRCAG